LLLVAPILEELIFRFALWEAVSDFIKNEELQVWISSLFFSLGHLVAMYMLSPDFRPFVLYQSMYVIILGFGVSQMRIKTGGVLGSILIHFLFNLGFYLGSLA
jgi:membrane protease YdiL (CAAX protease family)